MSEVQLEVRIDADKKKELLKSIATLVSVPHEKREKYPHYSHYTWFMEALREAGAFFYSFLPEKQAREKASTFIEDSDAKALSAGLNQLWTGTFKKKSTEYHKALYWQIANYIVDEEFGEWVKAPPEPPMQHEKKEPWKGVFELAREAEAAAPERKVRNAYPAYKRQ